MPSGDLDLWPRDTKFCSYIANSNSFHNHYPKLKYWLNIEILRELHWFCYTPYTHTLILKLIDREETGYFTLKISIHSKAMMLAYIFLVTARQKNVTVSFHWRSKKDITEKCVTLLTPYFRRLSELCTNEILFCRKISLCSL